MDNGWIKLHRSIFENISFNNEKCFKIWIWCLLKVNHKDNIFLLGREKISLKKGQFIMGSKKESEFLNIAKSTLWFWLEFLEREGQVELKKTTKYTIITVPNWEKYQVLGLKSDSNQDADGTQIGTNKNDKKNKNEKKNTHFPLENDITAKIEGTVIKPIGNFSDVSLVIKAFEPINPASKTFYGHKTQREACEELIKTYGLDQVLDVVKNKLPETNTLPFYPNIISPAQLRFQWVTLDNMLKKEVNRSKGGFKPYTSKDKDGKMTTDYSSRNIVAE